MCVGDRQMLCYFIKDTWASRDFGIWKGESWNQFPMDNVGQLGKTGRKGDVSSTKAVQFIQWLNQGPNVEIATYIGSIGFVTVLSVKDYLAHFHSLSHFVCPHLTLIFFGGRVSLCSLCWSLTCDHPASASWVLGLKHHTWLKHWCYWRIIR
jgi:hypothetical protein